MSLADLIDGGGSFVRGTCSGLNPYSGLSGPERMSAGQVFEHMIFSSAKVVVYSAGVGLAAGIAADYISNNSSALLSLYAGAIAASLYNAIAINPIRLIDQLMMELD